MSVFDSDRCVHSLLTTPAIVRSIASSLGSGYVDESGGVIRSELRKLVFSDDAARKELERIVHPAVFSELQRAVAVAHAKGGVDCFLADVPLFFEGEPPDINIDQVLVVAASRGVQVRRITERSMGEINPPIAN